MIETRVSANDRARRLRRLRRTQSIRDMVSETHLDASALVYPLFCAEGLRGSEPIEPMPGQSRHGLDALVERAGQALALGVRSVLIFGVPARKDPTGSEAWSPLGISQRAIAALKQSFGETLTVIADLCLCEYTDHGHCGVVSPTGVDNDATLELYRQVAVAQAEAGADMVAPSGMMDHQVAAIRQALDGAGQTQVAIMAYGAKYASAFYGPFREAAGSTPGFGDRRGYQLDPGNRREAMLELEADLGEGADVLMVKPALAYLDVLAEARRRFGVPTAAYNVSAEYAMVKAASERGWIDERRLVLEVLTSIRRAGADIIITYHAPEAAAWLSEG